MEARKELHSSVGNGDGSGKKISRDIISNLHESILFYILSFLDMKYVVQTSVLSKRWRYIWTTIPSLSFDRELFPYDSTDSEDEDPLDYNERGDDNFIDIVKKVLYSRQSSSIESFYLYWGGLSCDTTHTDPLLSIVVLLNVQELNLQFRSNDGDYELPDFLSNCKSLTFLLLDLSPGIQPEPEPLSLNDSINLPALRTLHLINIRFEDESFFKLFSGCPVLEDLTLASCEFDESKSLIIYARQLKHLCIEYFFKGDQDPTNCKIIVSAPNLVTFTCSDYDSHEYSLESLSSLETADIAFDAEEYAYNRCWKLDGPICTIQDANRMMKFLKGLYNVKSLSLTTFFLEFVSETPEVLTKSPMPFNNLKYLKLDTWICKACSSCTAAIMYMLRSSYSLETLVIDIASIKSRCEIVDVEYLGEEEPLQHPKFIEVWNFRGHVEELDLLKILLKNVGSLVKLIISSSKIWSAENEERIGFFTDELQKCPRASSDVRIIFSHGSL